MIIENNLQLKMFKNGVVALSQKKPVPLHIITWKWIINPSLCILKYILPCIPWWHWNACNSVIPKLVYPYVKLLWNCCITNGRITCDPLKKKKSKNDSKFFIMQCIKSSLSFQIFLKYALILFFLQILFLFPCYLPALNKSDSLLLISI